MAFDTVMDKSQLEAALTATANAVRGKTGSSAKLTWDQAKGFADAVAAIATGITPSGTINLTANGTHDVTNYASANVKVPAVNARLITATLASDVTTKDKIATLLSSNEWIKSIYSKENAFVLVLYQGTAASTAMGNLWFMMNKAFLYSGTTAYKTFNARQTASQASFAYHTYTFGSTSYGGHMRVNSSGGVSICVNSSYPVKAGSYWIIAGTMENM